MSGKIINASIKDIHEFRDPQWEIGMGAIQFNIQSDLSIIEYM